MSSGRWLRELSPHQAIRNACCFTRSASITSHTKCMLLYPLGEHHLIYASSVDTVFLATARAAPIASATLTSSSIAFSLTSTSPTPPNPPPSLSLLPSPQPLPEPPEPP